MSKLTKNQKLALSKLEAGKTYTLAEACELVKEMTFTKFDASFGPQKGDSKKRHQIVVFRQ